MLRSTLLACVACLAFAANAQAQINIVAGSNLQTFGSAPPSSQWSTSFYTHASNPASNTAAQNTAQLQTLSISGIANTLPTSSTNPPSSDSSARYNTTNLNLQTIPTGNAATFLAARLTNGTGLNVTSLNLGYDLKIAQSTLSTEQYPGHYLYYSLTGASNSWTSLGNFGANGTSSTPTLTPSIDIPVGTWTSGSPLYIVWIDDNADAGTEAAYQIDDVTFTPTVVPEPATLALLGVAGGIAGLAALRRRKA
ncbi:MAG: PEP-CTERM sorting domain-containing protein [Planctomycetota bacterium]|nr:PEP-CTERM sorting domain-containing protein [Planctomycetota bacterium]